MQYLLIQNIINATVENFTCPHCEKAVNHESLHILQVRNVTLRIGILCPHCQMRCEIEALLHDIPREMIDGNQHEKIFRDLIDTGGLEAMFSHGKTGLEEKDIQSVASEISQSRSCEELFGRDPQS